MGGPTLKRAFRKGNAFVIVMAVVLFNLPLQTYAAGSSQNPQSGSVGLEGTIGAPAPTQAATIITPTSGQTFTNTPITVSGLCQTGLLVKVFSNNVFVGSVQCVGGSYSLQVDLFSGQNDLVVRVYDALDQAGPDSNLVSITFNDAQFTHFGAHVSLSSIYAKLGADPAQELDWPVILSGGVGPYAISTDWGDGQAPTLQSVAFTGTITLKHTYASAGVYKVTVRATDTNGTTAFLQLVGVANGKVSQGVSGSGTSGGVTVIYKTTIEWWPAWFLLPFIVLAFWLGRRQELYSIRKSIEQSRNDLK